MSLKDFVEDTIRSDLRRQGIETRAYQKAGERWDNLTPEDFMDPDVERRSAWIEKILGDETELETVLGESDGCDRDLAKAVTWINRYGARLTPPPEFGPEWADTLLSLWRGVDRVIQEYVDDEIRKAVIY